MKVLLLIFVMSFFSENVLAYNPVATITNLRGRVSVLRPGALLASQVKVGDRLEEDTSILTGPKSFVKLTFDNGSIINLGPQSKIVVYQIDDTSKTGLVGLLKGKMRAMINRDEVSETKGLKRFYLRTRSAAMGVRGTDFLVGYQPENNATVLLTYSGKVAITKLDPSIDVTSAQDYSDGKVSARKINQEALKRLIHGEKIGVNDFENIMAHSPIYTVAQGQFSGTYNKLKKPTGPVNISPYQFTALSSNEEFLENPPGQLNTDLSSIFSLKPQIPTEVDPKGLYQAKKEIYYPQAGGHLDLESGFYIPPGKNAPWDARRKTYTASKSTGLIDVKTGQYAPPYGLKLDPLKGFVLDEKVVSKMDSKDQKLLVVAQSQLNTDLAQDILLGQENVPLSVYTLSMPEEYQKNTFVFSYQSVNTTRNKSSSIYPEVEYSADTQSALSIGWSQPSADNWRPFSRLGFQSMDYKSLATLGYTISSDAKKVSTLYHLTLGASYLISTRWELGLSVSLVQDSYTYFKDNLGTTELSLEHLTTTRPGVHSRFLLFSHKRLTGELLAGFEFLLSKKKGDLDSSLGTSYSGHLALNYWANHDWFFRLSGGVKNESLTITTSFEEADLSKSDTQVVLDIGLVL